MTDPLGIRTFGTTSRDRYTDQANRAAAARQAALDLLSRTGQLTGDQGAALPGVATAVVSRQQIDDDRLGGAGRAYSDWWDAFPGIAENRASGLAGAGAARFADVRKKLAAGGRRKGGGKPASSYSDYLDAFPWLSEEGVRRQQMFQREFGDEKLQPLQRLPNGGQALYDPYGKKYARGGTGGGKVR